MCVRGFVRIRYLDCTGSWQIAACQFLSCQLLGSVPLSLQARSCHWKLCCHGFVFLFTRLVDSLGVRCIPGFLYVLALAVSLAMHDHRDFFGHVFPVDSCWLSGLLLNWLPVLCDYFTILFCSAISDCVWFVYLFSLI